MQIVHAEAGWHLVCDDGVGGTTVLATLRSQIEVVAVLRLCEETLQHGRPPSRFDFEHAGGRYEAHCLGDEGEKVVLHVTQGEGKVSVITTEFVHPKSGRG